MAYCSGYPSRGPLYYMVLWKCFKAGERKTRRVELPIALLYLEPLHLYPYVSACMHACGYMYPPNDEFEKKKKDCCKK